MPAAEKPTQQSGEGSGITKILKILGIQFRHDFGHFFRVEFAIGRVGSGIYFRERASVDVVTPENRAKSLSSVSNLPMHVVSAQP